GDRVLSELRYGPAGVPVPTPGTALLWTGRTWGADSLPVPTGFSGTGQTSVACGARCEVQSYQLSLGDPQLSTADTGDLTGFNSAIHFDVRRGELSVRSAFRRSQLLMGDAYSLSSAVAGDSVGMTIEMGEQHADTCLTNRCLTSTRRVLLLVNGVV